MYSVTKSFGLNGLRGFAVAVEADVSGGLPAFSIVGLPDSAVRESADRVRAAIKNLGFKFPDRRITVNLAPADVRKTGPVYDLPLLLAVLTASGQLEDVPEDSAFLGELALDGTLRPVSGVLPMALAAAENGIRALLPALGKVDMALVGEPTGMQAATGERGLVVLDCTAHGRSGHAARGEGVNALYIALDDIARLRSFRFGRESELLGPIGIAVTQIEAGTQHNVVPDTCRFVVDVRTTDAYSNEETVGILRAALRSDAVPRSTRIRAAAVGGEHPLVKAAVAAGRETYVSPTTSDRTLMPFPALKMGPGQSSRSHTADEFVLLEEIAEGIAVYEKYIEKLAQEYGWKTLG